ncbi:hypothetical protein NUSPORA_02959 [Nucleospora cyclopteri]
MFNLGRCNNKISQYVRQEAFNPSKNTSIHPNYSAQKTLESISLDFRRGLQEECKKKDLSDIAITLMEKKEGTDSNTAE